MPCWRFHEEVADHGFLVFYLDPNLLGLTPTPFPVAVLPGEIPDFHVGRKLRLLGNPRSVMADGVHIGLPGTTTAPAVFDQMPMHVLQEAGVASENPHHSGGLGIDAIEQAVAVGSCAACHHDADFVDTVFVPVLDLGQSGSHHALQLVGVGRNQLHPSIAGLAKVDPDLAPSAFLIGEGLDA